MNDGVHWVLKKAGKDVVRLREKGGVVYGRAIAAAVLVGIFLSGRPSIATEHLRAAGEVKGAFVYNIIKFVEWPEGALPDEGEILVGVRGECAACDAVMALGGKRAKGRTLRVVRASESDDPGKYGVLFVGDVEAGLARSWLAAVEGRPVLTLGDAKGFCAHGGMVELYVREDRVRFDIDLSAARKAGLRVSAKLLHLAGKVYKP